MPDLVLASGPAIFGGIVLLLAAILIGAAFLNLKRMRESEGWPQVEGEIIESEVVRRMRSRAKGESPSFRVEYEYKPHIRYRYTIRGIEYTGNRIGFIDSDYATEKQALDICNHYPVGNRPPVYYDQWRPECSVLKPGVALGGLMLYWLLGGLLGGVGVFILLNF